MAAAEECEELHSASVFSPAQTVNQDLCLVYKASLEEKKKYLFLLLQRYK